MRVQGTRMVRFSDDVVTVRTVFLLLQQTRGRSLPNMGVFGRHLVLIGYWRKSKIQEQT
jgi:hypothetical protein